MNRRSNRSEARSALRYALPIPLLVAGLAFIPWRATANPPAATDGESPPGQTLAGALAAEAADYSAGINSKLNLINSTIVQLDIPMKPGEPFDVQLPLEGAQVTLRLRPNSVRAPSYEVRAYGADGTYTIAEPTPENTYEGEVAEWGGGSRVGASLRDEGLDAVMIASGGQRWFIEPLRAIDPRAPRSDHVLYRGDDVLPNEGTCGGPFEASGLPDGGGPEGGCGASVCVAELGCDADFEYYTDWGSSVANVQNRINLVINTMNTQYINQVGIRHQITTILVRTAEPDPYSSTSPSTLLSQFRSEWLNNQGAIPRDLAHLFTGKNLDGSVIGIAWDLGVVCTTSAYCLSESDCCGSLACATDLSAHELGHLWNGQHCTNGANSTMAPSITCVNSFLGCLPDSVGLIVGHRDTRTCLSPEGMPPPFSDTFPSTTIDTTKWTTVTGALINTAASNEPSAPNSLNLDSTDQIWSNYILLGSGFSGGTISYYTQRVGPAASESLRVEYFDSSATWVEINNIPGGTNQTVFQFWSHNLNSLPGAGAYHNSFRIRFRALGNAGTDDWYIDDVGVVADPDSTPPTPNPMTWVSAPAPLGGFPTGSISMTCSTASDPTTPIQYQFQETTGNPGATSSGWQSTTFWSDGGLTPNTVYTYEARARDGLLNQTAPAVGSTATHIQTPTGVTAGVITSTSIELFATGTLTNLGQGMSGVYFDSTTGGGNGGINEWVPTNTDTATGLQPNTLYTFRVKARNQHPTTPVETPYSPTAQFMTLPATGGCDLLGDINDDGLLDGRDASGFARVKAGIAQPGDIVECADYGSGTVMGDVTLFVADLLN